MEEHKTTSESYDATDRPFDVVGGETAMVCEADPETRQQITTALNGLGYQVVETASAKDALKSMRFHVFNAVVVGENFDAEGLQNNSVYTYLADLAMVTRRQIFVVLISDQYRTNDNLAAFNRSVNLIVNRKNLEEFATAFNRCREDNLSFYRVFNEGLQKIGKL